MMEPLVVSVLVWVGSDGYDALWSVFSRVAAEVHRDLPLCRCARFVGGGSRDQFLLACLGPSLII